MKIPILFFLLKLLLTGFPGVAQTMLPGDSIYHGLQSHKDSLTTVLAQLGQHYHKTEIRNWFHAHMRDGGDVHGTRLAGYALRYKRIGVTCCVDEETGQLFRIQLDHHAFIVSARGIRPGRADFAMVIETYGPSDKGNEHAGNSKVSIVTDDRITYFTALRYPHITFVSWGKPKAGEDLLKRKVQEIWLR